MSKFFRLCALLVLVAACSEQPKTEEVTITNADGKSVTYSLEVAKTPAELEKGLMNRTSLAENSGMIFDLSGFESPATAMWMKDTLIPLDMLFVDKEGMVYWVYENAEPNSTTTIIAPYPAHAVIELNGGEIAKNGLQMGDVVKHSMFTPSVDEEAQKEELKKAIGTVPESEQQVCGSSAHNHAESKALD